MESQEEQWSRKDADKVVYDAVVDMEENASPSPETLDKVIFDLIEHGWPWHGYYLAERANKLWIMRKGK